MKQSFHGRTLATIATGKEQMQRGFGPMPSGFHRISFNDLTEVEQHLSEQVAAIILEPIQGEGGIHPAEKAYIQALRELCDRHDIVLIFDEIQSGIARSGKFFAMEHFGVKPDIMTLAKGLGNGIAIGAILSNEKVSQAIDFGDHGTTFGGNPLACAAALATINTIEEEGIVQEAERKGQLLRYLLEEQLSDHPAFREVRGKGLMIGVEFDLETKPLVLDMLKNGVIANATSGNVLRLVPPLTISDEVIRELVSVIKSSLENICA
jgi:acetylornithine/N-succinyldiaminopimelate aminotransferase